MYCLGLACPVGYLSRSCSTLMEPEGMLVRMPDCFTNPVGSIKYHFIHTCQGYNVKLRTKQTSVLCSWYYCTYQSIFKGLYFIFLKER